MLIHLDLESGIGGFALAAEWAGFTTICFVEIDKYCQKVLRKHWPNVPIVDDVRNVEEIKRIVEGRTVTLATAGVPCQPASSAGRRRGKEDNRWLWPETFDVVRAIKPKWCLFENVAGILTLERGMVFGDLLFELERIGYEIQAFIIPACAVNAPHRRDRVWIVAHYSDNGRPWPRLPVSGRQSKQKNHDAGRYGKAIPDNDSSGCCGGPDEAQLKTPPQPQVGAGCKEDMADGPQQRLQRVINARGKEGQEPTDKQPSRCRGVPSGNQWALEPELGRVAHGIPHRVDRLRCLGNAIVPQVAYQMLKVIAEIEDMRCLKHAVRG